MQLLRGTMPKAKRIIFRVVPCSKGERDEDGKRVNWKIDKPRGWDDLPQQCRLLSLCVYKFDDAPVLGERKELPDAWPLYYGRKTDAVRVGVSLG